MCVSEVESGGRLDLAIVMPVYNEEACIAAVARSWLDAAAGLGVAFRLIVLNDGSRDRTGEELLRVAGDPRIEVVTKPNEGHGPTVMRGYRRAVAIAEWVFQTDSDDEIPASDLLLLWRARESADFVLGVRKGRCQTAGRRLITWGARRLTAAVAGGGVQDVNVPFRLMRSAVLAPMMERVPADTFAPNVALSGLAARRSLRIVNVPVEFRERRTGCGSLAPRRLLRIAWTCGTQTLNILRRDRA